MTAAALALELDVGTARHAHPGQLRQAAKEAAAEEETRSNVEQVKRGPPRTPGSTRDVARRTGVPIAEQSRAEAHVALGADAPGWLRADAPDAALSSEREAVRA
jgi:hypothetical protein